MRTLSGECPCGYMPPRDDDAHPGRCVTAFLADPALPRTVVRAAVGSYLRAHSAAGYRRADIESDAWWGMARALSRYDSSRGASVRTWVEVRVRGAIVDGERTRSPLSRRAHEAGLTRAKDPLPMDAVDWGQHGGLDPGLRRVEDVDALTRCLALVSVREASILTRTYLAGHTLAEVAADLGITESGVTRLRQTAIRRIRTRLAWQQAECAARARWLRRWEDAAA